MEYNGAIISYVRSNRLRASGAKMEQSGQTKMLNRVQMFTECGEQLEDLR